MWSTSKTKVSSQEAETKDLALENISTWSTALQLAVKQDFEEARLTTFEWMQRSTGKLEVKSGEVIRA